MGEKLVVDPSFVANLMKISLQTFPKLSQKCPCKSGNRLKKCHFKGFILFLTSSLFKIPKKESLNIGISKVF